MTSGTAHVNPLEGFSGYESKCFTFKKVDDLELKLDILFPSEGLSSKARNVVMHIHGGFLVSLSLDPLPSYTHTNTDRR